MSMKCACSVAAVAVLALSACEQKPAGPADPNVVAAEDALNAEDCKATDLKVVLESHDKQAGVQNWAFVNTGPTLCTLNGKPAVFYGTVANPEPIIVQPEPGTPKTITVLPGGKAIFAVTYPAGRGCRQPHRMEIDPPNDRTNPAEFKPAPEICGPKVNVTRLHGKVIAQ